MQAGILIIMCVWSIAVTVFAIFYKVKESKQANETKEQKKKENEKNAKQITEIKEINAKLDAKPNDVGFRNALELLQKYSTKPTNNIPPNSSNTL